MVDIELQVGGLKKVFGRRIVFSEIFFDLRQSGSLTVSGKNGSGKSTLLKILAGVLSPSGGSVNFSLEGRLVTAERRYCYVGFVAPYLQLYEEFSALENLEFFRRVRGLDATGSELVGLLERLGLKDRRGDPLGSFSSGMKQRVKYAFALLHEPPVLLLDEPTANLDSGGVETVYEIIEEQKRRGIVVIATNDARDIHRCEEVLDLDEMRRPVRA